MLSQMTDREVIKTLYLSQGLVILAGIAYYFIFFRDASLFMSLWIFNWKNVILLGFGTSIVIVILECIIDKMVPEAWYDDGGINKRMFKALSYPQIFVLMAVVAIAEECVFRGLIQTQFGLTAASLFFALIHVRYIKKPLLLTTAIVLGFYLGCLFLITESLLVPIIAHYTIDVLLGIILKRQLKKQEG
ncbi:hypothetical protein EV207_102168 [Scopulibacillus darangshiensis]|uniref:CAAX prenyl protease 2/Lysostaphin resistance protein A-like domain-containing protein n=2 Tax=Scopulibacillus darangshiensis TaxID=442528 RepID=A0A4R2PBB2_9BACL|nr:hypothetical protein EV207_102168 [Scopulibacillus darangshiensis]